MALREEELKSLFTAIEAMIDEALDREHGRDAGHSMVRASELKQECINLIAFGESPA